jgi:hypothetical protein
VIRFSAALVAVAIGVLIGGIATSELLLVYIAIVVSAVALVVLAIGIVLKREELFGEGQGLVPVGAGASPVVPVRIGASHDRILPNAHVVPPPLSQEAAGVYAAAFGGTPPVASSAAADLTAARPAATGQGRSADWAPPWVTTAAREPWSSPAPGTRPERMPAGQDERTAAGAGTAGSRAPSAWQNRTPGAALSGWAVPDAAAQAAATAPKSWVAPSSGSPDAPDVKPSAGSGAKPPSWFDRLGESAHAAAPAATSASASGAGDGWPWSSRDNSATQDTASEATVPEDSEDSAVPVTSADATASVDDGDDWPARYSWLDDEADEPVAADASTNAETRGAGTRDAAVGKPAAAGPDVADADVADAADSADADVAVLADPDDATEVTPASDLAPEAEVSGEPGDGIEPGAGSEPPAEASAADVSEISLVTVVPGVPRYHDPDCVLVRFMTDDDIKKMPIAQAKEAGCTPCGACQPEG